VSRIHVCSLAMLHATVHETGARSILSLLDIATVIERPASVPVERHIVIGISDISEPMPGHILAGDADMRRLLAFTHSWDRREPLVIHCYAGVSRSTAAAFIAACAANPGRDEHSVAVALRRASPTATPNPRLVALADQILGREGRMIAAIQAIGRGVDCFAGNPFAVELA